MCPPGVDQTERTPQQWQILVPRLRHMQRIPSENYRSTSVPETMLFNKDQSLNLWSKLAKPTISTRGLSATARHRRDPSLGEETCLRSLRLELLSTELLGMVLSRPELNKVDIIAVGIASDLLATHVLLHIQKEIRAACGSWAGFELACIGTYVTEPPESFIKDDLFKSSVPGTAGSGRMAAGRKLNWDAIISYDDITQDTEALWKIAFAKNADRMVSVFERKMLAFFKKDADAMISNMWSSPPDTKWQLRNLTTRKFVRCVPRVSTNSRVEGFVDDSYTLRVDDVLLMHISWTRQRPDPRGTGIFQGAWAGHCFDIVAREEGDVSLLQGWTDVTGDVLKEAVRIKSGIK